MINDSEELHQVLKKAKTIAIIGCSPNEYRTSNYAARFLQEKGFTVIPVNPHVEVINGEKCYDLLADIPETTTIDIVNVFRNSDYTADAVRQVVTWNKKTKQKPTIWTQLEVSSPEAEQLAKKHKLHYVKNRCIMVEWDRLFEQ